MTQKNIEIPFNFTPRPYQEAAWRALDGVEGKPETRIKRMLLRWPRRHGKDKFAWAYMIKEACAVAGNYYYVFPQLVDAKRALWENIDKDGFRTLYHLPESIIESINNNEMKIIVKGSGSVIRFLGLDDPDNIRGISARGIVFSEFAFQNPAGYKVLMPAISETNGWVIFVSTPNGPNHMYDMENRVINNPTWYVNHFQCMWPDLPNYNGTYVTQDKIRTIQEEEGFSDSEMASEYGASYTVGAKGSFFAECVDSARNQGRIGLFPVDFNKPVDTYWDLGNRDGAVIWFTQRDGAAIIFVDYYTNSFKLMPHYVDVMVNKGYKYRHHHLPHDCEQTKMSEILNCRALFETLCKESDISDEVITRPKMKEIDEIHYTRKIFPRCYFNLDTTNEGIKNLEMWHAKYDKKTHQYLKESVHDESSHTAKAFMQVVNEDDLDLQSGIGIEYTIKVINEDWL